MRAKLLLGIILVALLFIRVDTFHITPAKAVASSYLFSIEEWEIINFPRKWLNMLWGILPGGESSREERLAQLDDYLLVARRVEKEENRLEGPFANGSLGAAREGPPSRDYLNELVDEKEKLRAGAEEAVESELSAVLIVEGFGSRFNLIFPPVDIRFDKPPTMLIISPRDRIELVEAVMLHPDIPGFERNRIETKLLEDYNLSALVDNLAGLSTFPSLVSDLQQLRSVLQTSAHEWLHSFFFFRPFGQNYQASEEMFTLNETVADLVGRELGDTTFAQIGGDLSVSSSRYLSREKSDPTLAREMRETRLRTEELLAQGKVEEAEEYMKKRWWRLRLGGYRIRKLNQAYFAFRGRYAEGPASLSPIGQQVKELRGLFPDVASFVKTVSGVSSYQEFLDILERLKSQAEAASS
ncbi:MAG: hypothetical protein IIB15_05990 [Chloroflexi bacterium]|nr:hypothetical protein [Chloroflexota bacterium]